MVAPPPRSKAVVGGSWFGGGNRRRSSWFSSWRCLSALRGWSALACLGAVVLLGGHEGPITQFARVLGAAASVSEAASAVVTQALNATSHVGASVSDVILQIASNGLSASSNAWRGIDLVNVTARRCSGLLHAEDERALALWLQTPEAATLLPCVESNLSEVLVAAGTSVTASVPIARATTEELNLTGWFMSLQVAGSWAPSGFVQVQFDQIVVTFDTLWANPLWSAMNWHVESEREQILRLLRLTLLDLPRPVTTNPVQILTPSSKDSTFGGYSFQGGGSLLATFGQLALSLVLAFSLASSILVKTLVTGISVHPFVSIDDDWEKIPVTPLENEDSSVSGGDRFAVGGG